MEAGTCPRCDIVRHRRSNVHGANLLSSAHGLTCGPRERGDEARERRSAPDEAPSAAIESPCARVAMCARIGTRIEGGRWTRKRSKNLSRSERAWQSQALERPQESLAQADHDP